MENEERYRRALNIICGNLRSDGFDMRPISSQDTDKLADFGYAVLDGESIEEAIQFAQGGE